MYLNSKQSEDPRELSKLLISGFLKALSPSLNFLLSVFNIEVGVIKHRVLSTNTLKFYNVLPLFQLLREKLFVLFDVQLFISFCK